MAATAAAFALGAGVTTYVGVNAAKKKLARYLAQAMSTFFEIDPDQIESSLRSDTKLALNQVRLKPQDDIIAPGVRLEGEVDRIEFSWKWGGTKTGPPFVRNATLTIHGARFRILNKPKGGEAAENGVVSPTTATTDNQEATNAAAAPQQQPPEKADETVNRYVQQIIDQLALNITDLQITIETQQGSEDEPQQQQNLVMEAKSLQLVSLGREVEDDAEEPPPPAPPLSQRISVESFCVYIIEGGGEGNADQQQQGTADQQLWLLKPFGCTASVKRVSGQRFLSGLETGLEVVGEGLNEPAAAASGGKQHNSDNNKTTTTTTTTEEGVTIYAGTAQVQVLLRVMAMLLPKESTSSPAASSATTTTTTTNHSPSIRVDNNGGVECVSKNKDKDQEQNASSSAEQQDIDSAAEPSSSHFVLPLQSVKVILPNGSAIRMPDLCFHYRTDGSVCNVQAAGGIFVNNEYPLILLQDGARCLVDFTGNKILLGKPPKVGNDQDVDGKDATTKEDLSSEVHMLVACVTWHENEMKPFLEGFKKLAELAASPDDGDDVKSKESAPAAQAVVQTNPSDESEEIAAQQETNPSNDSTLAPPWSLEVDGIISARFEGGTKADRQWIEASLTSPSYVLSDRTDEIPSKISIKSARFGPTSFGDISIHMSDITLAANDFPVAATNDVQEFVCRVLCLDAF